MVTKKKRLAALKSLFEVDGGATVDLMLMALGRSKGAGTCDKDAIAELKRTSTPESRRFAEAYLEALRGSRR